MKEKRECKIVQDLLPNYIDKLTDAETNAFIEEHLKECEECRKMLENMQKEIELNANKREDKEINYIKKYSIRLKSFKILAIMFLLVVLIFSLSILRKMVILTSLMNKPEIDTSNCYFSRRIFYPKGCWIIEEYTKDNILLATSKYFSWEDNAYAEQVDYYKEENDQFSINQYCNLEKRTFPKGYRYPYTTLTAGSTTINLNKFGTRNRRYKRIF